MKMKTIASTISAATLSLMLSSPLLAQDTAPGATEQPGAMPETAPGAGAGQAPDMTTSFQASDIMNMKVTNEQGQDLGNISELIIDQQGNISHVVLDHGGVLGVGADRYAVPWDRIQVSPEQDTASLNVTEEQLSSEFAAFEEEARDIQREEQQPTDPGATQPAPDTSPGATDSPGGTGGGSM